MENKITSLEKAIIINALESKRDEYSNLLQTNTIAKNDIIITPLFTKEINRINDLLNKIQEVQN